MTSTNEEQTATQLPIPQGYHMLCAIPQIEKEFVGGIAKADITLQHEAILTTVLYVMEQGQDCYKDQKRFPTGAWCQKGDFVLVMPNSGGRIKIHDQEFRIIKDDSVLATVPDPRGVRRA